MWKVLVGGGTQESGGSAGYLECVHDDFAQNGKNIQV